MFGIKARGSDGEGPQMGSELLMTNQNTSGENRNVHAAGADPLGRGTSIDPSAARGGTAAPPIVQVATSGEMATVAVGATPAHDARLDEYQQVASQFRALTDIRFKLIGLLPAGTIATVLAAKDSKLAIEPAVATFGLVVTLCLATYNKRNDQLYNELVSRAAQLERELGLVHGSFSRRPTSWLSFGPWKVEHGWPVGLVYAASAAVWMYVLVDAVTPKLLVHWGTINFGPVWPWAAAASILIAWQVLRAWEKNNRKALRDAVVALKEPFGKATKEDLVERMKADKKILSLLPDEAAKTIERRLAFQEQALKGAQGEKPDYAALSLVLSNVIDLPARWIHDVWTGRR